MQLALCHLIYPLCPPPPLQQPSPHTLSLNSGHIVNLVTRMPPTSSMLSISSPGGAPATGPRVVRGFRWQGGGPAVADGEAREP